MEIQALLKAGTLAGIVAAAVNIIIYFIAKATGGVSDSILLPGGKPLKPIAVIVSSFIPAILAACVLFGLSKFSENPIKVFTITGILIFIMSLGGPLGIPALPRGTRATLAFMHIVAAGVIIFFLNRIE
jgi:hypothetical protein